MPICPYCQNDHPANAEFCPVTGQRILTNQVAFNYPQKNKKNIWYVTGAIGIIMILIGFFLLLYSPTSLFYEFDDSIVVGGSDSGAYASGNNGTGSGIIGDGFNFGRQGQGSNQSSLGSTNTPYTSPIQASTRTPAPTRTLVPTPTPTPIPGTNPRDNAYVMRIPEGEFVMGLTDDQLSMITSKADDCLGALESAQPAHDIYLDEYWIYQTEVTNQMYQKCVDAGACNPPNKNYSAERTNYFGNVSYADFPVVMVSWQDAHDYCAWAGGRLPTEAEWEKAARGTDGRLFPWGNEFPNWEIANFNFNQGDTTSVFDYPKGVSPYGVFNMAGNVYEWVNDWYSGSYYQVSPSENPTGPENASGELSNRVVRGGSWGWDAGCACSASHDWWEEYESGTGVGFRCVLDENPLGLASSPMLDIPGDHPLVAQDNPLVEAFSSINLVYYDDFMPFDSTVWKKFPLLTTPEITAEGLVIEGLSGWQSGLALNENNLAFGEGALIAYSYSDTAEFEVKLEVGEWGTTDYHRVGVFLKPSAWSETYRTNIYQGKTQIGMSPLEGETRLRANALYWMFLGLDEDGVFHMLIWKKNRPQESLFYSQSLASLPEEEWTFGISGNNGVFNVESYTRINFDS